MSMVLMTHQIIDNLFFVFPCQAQLIGRAGVLPEVDLQDRAKVEVGQGAGQTLAAQDSPQAQR